MRMHWSRFVLPLALGFVAGCLVVDVYVPRANAQASAGRARWEYRCVSEGDYTSLEDVVTQLNKVGAEGWELVATGNRTSTTSHFCLKRPF